MTKQLDPAQDPQWVRALVRLLGLVGIPALQLSRRPVASRALAGLCSLPCPLKSPLVNYNCPSLNPFGKAA